ncbi:MAG: hypothetical protein LE178_06215 [Endomicrobium sp.]|nr:hypothetical protein [Endomicrobium sp.]
MQKQCENVFKVLPKWLGRFFCWFISKKEFPGIVFLISMLKLRRNYVSVFTKKLEVQKDASITNKDIPGSKAG